MSSHPSSHDLSFVLDNFLEIEFPYINLYFFVSRKSTKKSKRISSKGQGSQKDRAYFKGPLNPYKKPMSATYGQIH